MTTLRLILILLAVIASPAVAQEYMGNQVFVGDMVFDRAEFNALNQGRLQTQKAILDLSEFNSQRWPRGVIPLAFDSSFTAGEKRLVYQACAKWGERARISCHKKSRRDKMYVQVTAHIGRGCYAQYGAWRGGPSALNLQRDIGCIDLGVVMHEFGHLLGLAHEHQRPDRDTYIEIVWSNVERTRASDFNPIRAAHASGPYDFASIMHYAPFLASGNGKATILLRPAYSQYTQVIGSGVLNAILSPLDHSYAIEAYGAR